MIPQIDRSDYSARLAYYRRNKNRLLPLLDSLPLPSGNGPKAKMPTVRVPVGTNSTGNALQHRAKYFLVSIQVLPFGEDLGGAVFGSLTSF